MITYPLLSFPFFRYSAVLKTAMGFVPAWHTVLLGDLLGDLGGNLCGDLSGLIHQKFLKPFLIAVT